MKTHPSEVDTRKLNITTHQELLHFFSLSFYYAQGLPSLQHWIMQHFFAKGGSIAESLLTDQATEKVLQGVVIPASHREEISPGMASRELATQMEYLRSSATQTTYQRIRLAFFTRFLQKRGLKLTILAEESTLRDGRFGVKSKKSVLREILSVTNKQTMIKDLLQVQFMELLLSKNHPKLTAELLELDFMYQALYQEPLVPTQLLEQIKPKL